MTDHFRDRAAEVKRLHDLTKLQVLQIRSDPLRAEIGWDIFPTEGYVRVVGIRLFHGPREAVITRIEVMEFAPVRSPVDAAAYAVEAPLPPLEPSDSPELYRGDPLRFIAVDWGMIARVAPLRIQAKPYEPNLSFPQRLEGYLVVEPEAVPNPMSLPFQPNPFQSSGKGNGK